MRGEIQGLKAGTYYSEDESALVRVSMHDDGVIIEVADFDADIFYEFVVNEKGETKFNYGQVTPTG
tara:strand:+ start:424006 stop:424203 length:198 start_codon:yes stop_codon:yes gene_type:complete